MEDNKDQRETWPYMQPYRPHIMDEASTPLTVLAELIWKLLFDKRRKAKHRPQITICKLNKYFLLSCNSPKGGMLLSCYILDNH